MSFHYAIFKTDTPGEYPWTPLEMAINRIIGKEWVWLDRGFEKATVVLSCPEKFVLLILFMSDDMEKWGTDELYNIHKFVEAYY